MTLDAPWSDRALKVSWDEVERVARDNQLPLPTRTGWKFDELGCGHYGCVMATSDPGVVFKVTSDPTEAKFIEAAGRHEWPEGIVRYHAMTELASTYRRRKLFAIWREAAFDIGTLSGYGRTETYDEREEQLFARYLSKFKDAAHILRVTITGSKNPERLVAESRGYKERAHRLDVNTDPMRFRGPARVAAAWIVCVENAARLMGNERGYLVGEALDHYMDLGMLLCDVHLNNVGKVNRADYGGPIWVITDPGHLLQIKPW